MQVYKYENVSVSIGHLLITVTSLSLMTSWPEHPKCIVQADSLKSWTLLLTHRQRVGDHEEDVRGKDHQVC